MARLAEVLTAWEGHRAALEASTREIVAALAAVREHVRASNADISRCRQEVERHKRRRLCVPTGSGSAAAAEAAEAPASTVGDEANIHAAQQGAVASAESELQVLAQVLATVEVPVQRLQLLLEAKPLAAAREARNEECSALVRLMSSAHLGQHEQSGAYILRSLSVVALWRLRRVSRSFRRWGTEVLAAMPRPVLVGGETGDGRMPCCVEGLDMASLRWSTDTAMPMVAEAWVGHALCGLPGGQITVVGGVECTAVDEAYRWQPGSNTWETLPSMSTRRKDAVAVALGDGRVFVAGGLDDNDICLASAEVLAADGSSWSAVAPMRTARFGAVGGLLPGGRVIVAGGSDDENYADYCATAELWDPVTNVWTELPPMTKARLSAAGCMLPDGRFAVVGGCTRPAPSDTDTTTQSDGEMYDCARNEWTPLPTPIGMVGGGRQFAALVPVAGGMLICGGDAEDRSVEAELWDEESKRWLKLPYGNVPFLRGFARAVAVPVGALCKAPATS